MKIITWNCNGAFRNKFKYLDQFDADIVIIQECEDPLKTNDLAYGKFAENYLWIGDNKNKGLGVFAKKHLKIQRLNWSNVYQGHVVNYFLPFCINGEQNLVAVWAHRNNSPTFGYIGQIWKYLQINNSKIKDTIFVGDFNSNKIWDCWDRWWNHSDVVEILGKNDIRSLYHCLNDENEGEERVKTFYLHKNESKGYHIDYCFLPKCLIKKDTKIKIANFDDWKLFSDHLPMIIEF